MKPPPPILCYLNKLIKPLTKDSKRIIITYEEITAVQLPMIELLVTNGLLAKANPADTIICLGCEEQCLMEVNKRYHHKTKQLMTFIACDKRDDIGRVTVSSEQLQQWYTSYSLLAKQVAYWLGYSPDVARYNQEQGYWLCGQYHHKKYWPIYLLDDQGVKIKVAGYVIDLVHLLKVNNNEISLNETTLLYYINTCKEDGETPEERAERIVQRLNQEQRAGNRKFLQTVADEEGVHKSRIQQIRDSHKKRKQSEKNQS